jgi:hypothetical protein
MNDEKTEATEGSESELSVLLCCPFCGSKAITSTYYIECQSCDVSPSIDWYHMNKNKAIEAWNMRATPSNAPEMPLFEGTRESLNGLTIKKTCHDERPCINCFTDKGDCTGA